MSGDGLFDDLPEVRKPGVEAAVGRPRFREPARDQIELRAVDLDSLLGPEHPARVIWSYVERLDLSALEAAVKAREGRPGHPAISPRLQLALWLYAAKDGVGSARALARLCEQHDAYRWLCGGVSVNPHTLSDFRVGQGALLDRLLTENVAALLAAGVIDLRSLAQDGIRVRASAGAGSFRRRHRLKEHLAAARDLVTRLKREVDDDPAASSRRAAKARERAARERQARVEAALKTLDEVEAQRQRRRETTGKNEKKKEPRASSTDAQARVMKMADGGFRPAYNVQVISTAGEPIVVDVEPVTTGSDRGLLRPGLERAQRRLGRLPERYLADGGFAAADAIEWAHGQNVEVYCAPSNSKHGTDPYAPRRDDGPGVRAWRQRMASDAGQAIYKVRPISECIHAHWRNGKLWQFTVRGLAKVKAVMLFYALANNILQGERLKRPVAA